MQKAKGITNKFIHKWRKYGDYILLGLPGFIMLFIFRYLPMGGLIVAFKDYNVRRGFFDSPWVGAKWYNMLFMSDDFSIAFMNTLIISLLKLVCYFPVPIILAILLNELNKRYFARTIQAVIYLPHFISWAILSGILFSLFSPQLGILKVLGIEKSPLLMPGTFRWLLVLTEIWKASGWGTIIYLAAISGIDPNLYEAAIIDGANRFKRIWYITLPSISGTIVVLLILRLGNILDAGFGQVYMLYNASVYDVADIIDTYIFRVGLSTGRFSLATAAGLFKSVIGLILVLVSNRLAKIFNPDAGIM
ncbi:MAG: ABC transporter permease subunit [Firmicutes bacterium]|nr:ABC transporter permease subunit [Bacillota bacterium]